MISDGGEGWRPWPILSRVAAGAMTVPVVVGFVALGAVVVVARSVRDVARETWALVPGRRPNSRGPNHSNSDAA